MSNAGVIYEVDMEMPTALYTRERQWLRDHIQAMLQQEGFSSATLHVVESLDVSNEEDNTRVCVHYKVASRVHLQSYFENGAAAMRADGVAHLGTRCRFRRRVLVPDSRMRAM